uniref:Symplekin-like n=1 Tax=Dermatophagoides pteronyssinus TaxID=6956 RepID=A0A6P6Y211_DERPT|nr:symplekin-like [Dermatophagoides pteronyssinus]
MSTNSETDCIESRVIDFLENAISSTNESEKVSFLNQAQELVIHNDILDNFLDEILGFQNDKFSEVRKFVAGFIEATCKKDPDFFPKIIVNLSLMLADEVPNVLKRVIQALTQLYKIFLPWIATAKVNEEAESTGVVWNQIKNQVFSLIDLTENDGVRTQCVKFIEMVIVCQTRRDNFSKEVDFSLDQIVNVDKKLIDIDALEDEAKQLFEQLINFQSKIHISSVNLMATMQSLSLIARQRSRLFFDKVVLSFEALSTNLPPTLAKSQVNSVNKQLKLLMLMLFKHPYIQFSKYQSKITQTLLNIGVKQSEINRSIQDCKKRGIKIEASNNNIANEPKRIKIEIDEDDEEMENNNGNQAQENEQPKFNLDTSLHDLSRKFSRYDAIKAADITAKDLIGRLNNPNIICDLVLTSLHLLPDDLTPEMTNLFKDFSFTLNDPATIAKKIAFYFTGMGIGPGIDEVIAKYMNLFETQYHMKIDNETNKKITSMVKKLISREMKNQQQSHNKVKLVQSGKKMTSAVKIKQLKLEDITKPLELNEKIRHMEKCIGRILVSNQSAQFSAKQYENYRKIIGKLSSNFVTFDSLKSLIKEYIFQDIRSRYDILFNALYLEYINCKSLHKSMKSYSDYLTWIIESVLDTCEQNDIDFFLQKLYLESPLLDERAIEMFKNFVLHSEDFESSSTILRILVEKRPAYRREFLNCLLQICIETENPEIHQSSLAMIIEIYQNSKFNLKETAESFALECLNLLKNDTYGPNVFGSKEPIPWNDEAIKVVLAVYLKLLPLNQKLIHELPNVYVATNAHIKRIILRLIQEPIQDIDMNSTEIIKFVQNGFIEGAEIIVSRVIHILTDKQKPSPKLVACVKDLYQKQKRVTDVRFLIPVLSGFSKREIIEILPQLIKLNPNVIKEVFNRILVSHDPSYQSPISPADLMIALHNIDPSKCDLKTIIKAIHLCFEEKSLFTAEVLAIVMQMLSEQNPLPTLLMRTVIQTLGHYPRLISFVMNNILQRLILKQVWNQKKVWEGFIKCCQRTLPQSFPVLLQLPPIQLQSVFQTSPEIRPSLINYLQQMNEQQVALIPQSLLDIILSSEYDMNANNQMHDSDGYRPPPPSQQQPIESITDIVDS